ncbi:D-tyrosyl-tRNA(Tyr) deacylase [Bacteroidetes bacterium SCGC AAA795-G10]|nr:D-tyrosyl-tRNA(Tyr) deacylase [Bacteroidetes bacterium SCGC AAA795-G10]
MRAVIQRVKYAHVIIDRKEKRTSGPGLMILLGIGHSDNQDDVKWLANKILNLRIFNDVKGIMNQSIKEIKGEIMVISQFTLMAQTKKGNRPSYVNAAKHEHAIPLYNLFKAVTQNGLSKQVISGKFGSNMEVEIVNDGPVTICIDTKNRD